MDIFRNPMIKSFEDRLRHSPIINNPYLVYPSAVGPDFEDLFGSDDWTELGSGSNWAISGGALNFASTAGATERKYIDMLGATVSDTAWVLRFKLNIATLTHRRPENIATPTHRA